MNNFNWIENGSVTSTPGFKACGVTAGLKKSGKDKIIAAGVKKNFAAIADAGKKAVVTVSNISTDAQSAAADIITETADGKIYHSRCFLIFSNGKWLVNKVEYKGIIQ